MSEKIKLPAYRIQNFRDFRRRMVRLVKLTEIEEMDTKRAVALNSLMRTLLEVLREIHNQDLEERLAAVEAKLEDQKPEPEPSGNTKPNRQFSII